MTLVYKDGSQSWDKKVLFLGTRWSCGALVLVVWYIMCMMMVLVDNSGAMVNTNTTTTDQQVVLTVHNPWISLAPFNNMSFNSDTRNRKCLALDSGAWCFQEHLDIKEVEVVEEEEEENVDVDVEEEEDVGGDANQCLGGHRPLKSVCDMDGQRRGRVMSNLSLAFCTGYKLVRVLGNNGLVSKLLDADKDQCRRILDEVQYLDKLAQRIYCEFDEVLSRYDCYQNYSIKWTCDNCKEEYKRWVCAMLIPFHMEDQQVKPCREFCHRVEQKCPYLLPDTKLQYAGEPSFLCIDDNIPETESMSPCSAYGSAPNCYLPCHLDVDLATNQTSQLSSYDLWVLNASNCTATAPAPQVRCVLPEGSSSSKGPPSARLWARGWGRGWGWGQGQAQGGPPWPHGALSLAITSVCLAFVRTLVDHPFCLGLT